MKETAAEFANTYAQMTEGELARVLRGRRYLVPEARLALDFEVKRRSLDPEQLRRQRPRDREKRRRPFTAEKRLKGKWLRWPWMLALMISSVLLISLLDHFRVAHLFWPVVITVAVPVFTIWGFWELKSRLWFWATIAVIVVSNISLFSLIGWPWGTHWVPGRSIAGLCTLELIPIFALIVRLEKRMDRPGRMKTPAAEPPSSPADKIGV